VGEAAPPGVRGLGLRGLPVGPPEAGRGPVGKPNPGEGVALAAVEAGEPVPVAGRPAGREERALVHRLREPGCWLGGFTGFTGCLRASQ